MTIYYMEPEGLIRGLKPTTQADLPARPTAPVPVCPLCEGTGKEPDEHGNPTAAPCGDCKGSGIKPARCKSCGG